MINNRLPEFNQVAAGKTSQLKIPKYDLTLKEMELRLGGTTNTLALLDEIRLKIGTVTRWSVKGPQLQQILGYKGLMQDPLQVPIQFSERDMKDIIAEEVGGWDMTKIPDDIYLEVDINAAAVAPTMYARGWFTPPQGLDRTVQKLVQKYVRAQFQASAIGNTRNQLVFNPMGALVKRGFFQYTGTDWSPTTDGNLNKIEVKKNGGVVWEPFDSDARYTQLRYKHFPQSKMYVVDFIIDNNLSGALKSADAKALEWNIFVTAADTITAIFDVLDLPYNL